MTEPPTDTTTGHRPLRCPECREPAQHRPPDAWPLSWLPRPDASHRDGTPLCPVPGPHGRNPPSSPAPRPAPATREHRPPHTSPDRSLECPHRTDHPAPAPPRRPATHRTFRPASPRGRSTPGAALPIPPVNIHPDPTTGAPHVDFTTINTITATSLARARYYILCGPRSATGCSTVSIQARLLAGRYGRNRANGLQEMRLIEERTCALRSLCDDRCKPELSLGDGENVES
jgi:hypothetical protein